MNDVIGIIAIVLISPAVVLFLGFAIRESGKGHRDQEEVSHATPERSDAEVGRAA